jgi:hypothetical protein
MGKMCWEMRDLIRLYSETGAPLGGRICVGRIKV